MKKLVALLVVLGVVICAGCAKEAPKKKATGKVDMPPPAAGAKAPEAKPAETKPAETKPAETKPAETKPAETKPAETKPAETKPAEKAPPAPEKK